MVDVGSLTWAQFWLSVAYLLCTGLFVSLGVLRLFQQHIRQGVILLVSAVVATVIFLILITNAFS